MSESVVPASKRDSAPGKVNVSWAQFWAAFAAAGSLSGQGQLAGGRRISPDSRTW